MAIAFEPGGARRLPRGGTLGWARSARRRAPTRPSRVRGDARCAAPCAGSCAAAAVRAREAEKRAWRDKELRARRLASAPGRARPATRTPRTRHRRDERERRRHVPRRARDGESGGRCARRSRCPRRSRGAPKGHAAMPRAQRERLGQMGNADDGARRAAAAAAPRRRAARPARRRRLGRTTTTRGSCSRSLEGAEEARGARDRFGVGAAASASRCRRAARVQGTHATSTHRWLRFRRLRARGARAPLITKASEAPRPRCACGDADDRAASARWRDAASDARAARGCGGVFAHQSAAPGRRRRLDRSGRRRTRASRRSANGAAARRGASSRRRAEGWWPALGTRHTRQGVWHTRWSASREGRRFERSAARLW